MSRLTDALSRRPHGLAGALLSIAMLSGLSVQPANAQGLDYFPGDFSNAAILGNSLPGDWRPFSADSPWNQPIPEGAPTHEHSEGIMRTIVSEARFVRLSRRYMPALWVVNADNMPLYRANSPYPFDIWDLDHDGYTEAGVPVSASMWGEPTSDGHIIIVDPFRKTAWEMSRFRGIRDGLIDCTTFNIWDLTGDGVGDPTEGTRWQARGGRGSGFPVVAGLIRPEELDRGVIEHALVFIFSKNRDEWFVEPAARTDGRNSGSEYPMEGMRLQLDPSLTDRDFDAWGLTREAKVVARAMQVYGMYNGDNGGAMTLQMQLLDEDPDVHAEMLEDMFPGFADAVRRIPTNRFRVVDTGAEPTMGGGNTTVVRPMITPHGGELVPDAGITIRTATSDALITYTTDGTLPSRASTPYTGPISLTESATVTARAFRDDKTPSHPVRAEFWLPGDCRGPRQCEAP